MPELPKVSVVISAKNEEIHIGKRIENLTAQDYPNQQLEIIIVSDGSTDKTNEIVAEYEQTTSQERTNLPKVRLISLKKSKGKPNAVNLGISQAKGRFIVLTDSRQTFESLAIKNLIANFSDPAVGCVSGELFFLKDTESSIKAEMGLYWNIEKKVRKMESSIGSVAGATGAIYAIRKSLYQELPPETLLDDVLTPMNILLQGYRCIFDSTARAYDIISKDAEQEWLRKVRTLAGNWQFINTRPSLFMPLKNPIWWRFLSHKIFRLIVPFMLPLLLLSSIMAEGFLYRLTMYLQVAFYLTALTGWLVPYSRTFRIVNLSYFFITLNAVALTGFWHWASGRCDNVWKPVRK